MTIGFCAFWILAIYSVGEVTGIFIKKSSKVIESVRLKKGVLPEHSEEFRKCKTLEM